MLTRCPTCDTHFRVTSQQIKARAGMVRCGACQAVFNALATLVDEPANKEIPPDETPRFHQEDDIASGASTLELDMVAALMAEDGSLANTDIDTEYDISAAADNVDAETHDLSWLEDLPGVRPSNDAAKDEFSDEKIEPQVENDTAFESFSDPDDEARLEPQLISDSEEKAADESLPDNPSELADYLASPIEPAVVQPQRSWPWLLGSAIALIALLVQGIYYFRVELGTLRPEWRQYLQTACKPLDCEVPRPRHIDTISIDTSDLRPDPQQPGRLTLKAQLRSQASYAQEWPTLELTLTDVNDQKIAVRQFSANEYLPKGNGLSRTLAAGLPPRGEIAVSLPLDVGYLAAAGYRLYVFYP